MNLSLRGPTAAADPVVARRLRLGLFVGIGADRAFGSTTALQLGRTRAWRRRSRRGGAADPLGLSSLVGTLEKGKEADIVAVPGDPLKDIHVTEKVLFVMKRGKIFREGAR